MKAAVIGIGNVGMAAFNELLNLGGIDELALIARPASLAKVQAEVEDYLDALVLRPGNAPRLTWGSYEKCAGADVILYAAGVAQKPGQSRLELVETNVEIVKSVFAEVDKYNRDGIVICLSNPVDIITQTVVACTRRPRERVIGSGTLLDTARLVKHISGMLDLSPAAVNVFVLGEHGDSSCVMWSSLRVLGMSLNEYLSGDLGENASVSEGKLVQIVRGSAGKLIRGKGSTAYGVAAAARRIVSAIAGDTHEILPVSVLLDGEYGQRDVSVSVPCVLGRAGVLSVKRMNMTEEERAAFESSCAVLRGTAERIRR